MLFKFGERKRKESEKDKMRKDERSSECKKAIERERLP